MAIRRIGSELQISFRVKCFQLTVSGDDDTASGNLSLTFTLKLVLLTIRHSIHDRRDATVESLFATAGRVKCDREVVTIKCPRRGN